MSQVNTGNMSVNQNPHFLQNLINALNGVSVFSRWTKIAGITVLFLMVCLTFVDVIMRYIFNMPIKGVLEITEVMMIVSVFLAIAHTQDEKGHVAVDLISANLPAKPKLILEFITNLLVLGLFIIIIWRTISQIIIFVQTNSSHSQYFLLPDAPFASIQLIGCTALCLLLLRDQFKLASAARNLHLNRFHWLLMGGVPIAVMIIIFFWMQPKLLEMSLPVVGLSGVIISLVFFLMGMPIAFALILTSFICIGHIRGTETALSMIGTDLFRTVGSYNWSVLPFFVLMGYFCFNAKFGEDLFYAAYKWLGHFKGGMAAATIGACTAFAAIVGDNVSATATMGAVAMPQMKKYGYDDRLSVGCITGGASLGPIIPPSVVFIIYGLITNMSIGDLFVAGIIPGLLIAACFMVLILGWCHIYPNAGPAGVRSTWKERAGSLKAGGPVLILFVVVIGGIYVGMFTPTEGGAIGAVVAFILGLIMRRWTWAGFTRSLLDTGKVVSMVFLIIVGGTMFTRFAAWCNLSRVVSGLIASAGLSPTVYILIVMAFLLVAGCFIDLMPLLLIGVPIFQPIAVHMGINPLWFAMLVCLVINIGALTPPVGINLFVLKGLNKEIPMSTIYQGSMPFAIATLVSVIILFFAPPLVTWLPNVLK